MIEGPTASLHGVRVVVTRAKAQASTLVAALLRSGAEPVEVATIEVADPADGGAALQQAIAQLDSYEWVVLTSTNAVERYLSAVDRDEKPDRLAGVRHAAVGSATLEALQDSSVVADLLPERFLASALVDVFPAGEGRVLFPSAAKTAPTIVEGLTAKGWQVEQVEAYQTIAAKVSDEHRRAVDGADAALFTSGSSVDRFCELIGKDRMPELVICIGPTTAAAAESHGVAVSAIANPHTIDGLMTALQTAWTSR